MEKSTNLQKHTSSNPIQKFLIKRLQDRVAVEVKKLKPESLLSVGCGEGFDLKHVLKIYSPDIVYGVDFDRGALDFASKQLPKVKFKKADARKLPFKDKQFDMVIALEVIEHIEEYEKALGEINRVAERSIIITVPWEPWFSVVGLLRGKYLKRFGRHPEHVNAWGKRSFSEILKADGFRIIQHKIIFPWQLIEIEKGQQH